MSVILLHTNGVFWSRPHGMLWISANFIETFFYFAVPVFFMISGATLLDYREKYSTRIFLKKRFAKTLIPFVFWSIVAGLFNASFYGQAFDLDIRHIIDNILNTRYFSIYWFFTTLFAVYLSIPLLSAVERKIEVYTFSAIVGIVCIGIIPLLFALLGIGTWSIQPPVAGGYILYVLLGYIFSKVPLEKRQRYIIYVLGILGWLMHFLGTLYMSRGTDEINHMFKGYLNIPAILQAVGIFVFFQYLDCEKLFAKVPSWSKIVDTLASYTFGIYILHMFPMLSLTARFGIDTSLMTWRVGGAILIFGLCAIAVGIARKIPIVKYLLP